MENLKQSVKLLGAMVLGAAIGGAIGILYAPDKGSETRKKIVGKSDDLTDALKGKFNGMLEDIKKDIETAKVKASELVENGRVKAEKYI